MPPTENDRAFRCEYCNQTFKRLHNLKSHLYVHTGEKNHKCDSCDAAFSRLHDLKRHKRQHEGLKPFPCEYCGKSYSRQDVLHRHQKVENKLCSGIRAKEAIIDADTPLNTKFISLPMDALLTSNLSLKDENVDLLNVQYDIRRIQFENNILKEKLKRLNDLELDNQVKMERITQLEKDNDYLKTLFLDLK